MDLTILPYDSKSSRYTSLKQWILLSAVSAMARHDSANLYRFLFTIDSASFL